MLCPGYGGLRPPLGPVVAPLVPRSALLPAPTPRDVLAAPGTSWALVITLLSDFGLNDTYVGQMKGAILAVAPSATLVDLTHAVPPQDVYAGAFLLSIAVEAFAAGTIHVAVVDPGVGSQRRSVALRAARGDVFVGPDNGLLWPAVVRLGGCALAVAGATRPGRRSHPH